MTSTFLPKGDTRRTRTAIGLVLMASLFATGCTRELILPGDRFDTRTTMEDTLDPANSLGDATVEVEETAEAPREPVAISLPATRNLSSWTHRNGSIAHVAGHAAIDSELSAIWSAEIGEGDGRRHRISATPVAADGLIYTLDSRATVTATQLATGATVWQRDLTPAADRRDDASGGGLSVAGGTLYVSSSFGMLTALDAKTGDARWVQELEAAATAPATIDGGSVFITTMDGVARSIDAATGKILWTIQGAPNITGLTGGSGPAVSGRMVVLPLGSGEMIGALKTAGIRVWSTSVSGERRGRGYTGFTDITGDPVIVGGTVYAGNAQGKLAAVELRTGKRLWTAGEGAFGPVWPVGNNLFFLNDQAELIRMNARTGEVVWREQLPYFLDRKPRRLKDVNAHFGPVLAGGRLLVASDDGLLRGFDPASGAVVETVEIPGGAATAPIIVDGTVYVVSRRGRLIAYK